MDLIKAAVALQTEKVTQQAEIAMIKAKQEADQQLIDMVSEAINESKTVRIDDAKGQNVDKSI